MGWEQDLMMHLGGDSLLFLHFHACSGVYLSEKGRLTLGEVREICRVEGWP